MLSEGFAAEPNKTVDVFLSRVRADVDSPNRP
jgi:hypothetical protein